MFYSYVSCVRVHLTTAIQNKSACAKHFLYFGHYTHSSLERVALGSPKQSSHLSLLLGHHFIFTFLPIVVASSFLISVTGSMKTVFLRSLPPRWCGRLGGAAFLSPHSSVGLC